MLAEENILQHQAVKLPRVGITIGDIAGIGPEVSLKAVADKNIGKLCLPVLIGDADFLLQTTKDLDLELEFEIISKNEEISVYSDKIIIYDLNNINGEITLGKESGITGKASAEYIEAAVKLCQANKLDAIATAPISKKALSLGGYNFPGHTEFLALLTNTKDFAMSFFGGNLRVVLLSTHISLLDAISLIKKLILLS